MAPRVDLPVAHAAAERHVGCEAASPFTVSAVEIAISATRPTEISTAKFVEATESCRKKSKSELNSISHGAMLAEKNMPKDPLKHVPILFRHQATATDYFFQPSRAECMC